MLIEGDVLKNISTPYVPQESFIMNDTVRNNILFGNEMNEERYQAAVKSCQLEDDLAQLPGGDLTEIGEKGITTSGGQKARVMIARAVFADCDINLIDDSLSALDAYVGKKVFEQVVCGLMTNKTRIMVTHQIELLQDTRVTKAIYLEDGRPVLIDKPENLKMDTSFQLYCRNLNIEESKNKINLANENDRMIYLDDTNLSTANRDVDLEARGRNLALEGIVGFDAA